MTAWTLAGLTAALGEAIFFKNPGLYGTSAAIAGTAFAGLAFHLARGGEWRLGGMGAMIGGALMGAKHESMITAIIFGGVLGLAEGGMYRCFERNGNGNQAEPWPQDSTLEDSDDIDKTADPDWYRDRDLMIP